MSADAAPIDALLAGLTLMAGAFTLLDAWGLRNAARLMEAGGGFQ